MSPEERKRLVEVMARAVFERAPVMIDDDTPMAWSDFDRDLRDEMIKDQREAIAAAERAGFRWIGPDDGR